MWQLLGQLAALLSTRVGDPARYHLELAELKRIRYYFDVEYIYGFVMLGGL